MKLLSFQIKNFRSIVDSGKVPFSPDGITVFVGQNESGKSSILDALYFSMSAALPTDDDMRIGAELPQVTLEVEVLFSDLEATLDSIECCTPSVSAALQDYLGAVNNKVTLLFDWAPITKDGKLTFKKIMSLQRDHLTALLEAANSAGTASTISANAEGDAGSTSGEGATTATTPFDVDDFVEAVYMEIPLGVRFNEQLGALPNQVDINENGKPVGAGARAAENFLKIAEIDLAKLIKGDLRTRQNTMNRANNLLSEDFRRFWSQTIGTARPLILKCEIEIHPNGQGEKSGHPHLVFWICDGNTQLYPAQRSRGTRWFISFYLQLKASEKEKESRLFLLDEPGANLHAKAQEDVLKLINLLAKDISTVVYSTHSAQLLEYSKLFRVHAVQRNGEQDDCPTTIIDAHHLGAASSDTLSPVMAAMGIDFSQNRVVKKENNVLLEEMSGYYYMSAFWTLTEQKMQAHFIAATGVNKIEALANMFRGWGLHFIIALDDDNAGRTVYKSIKKELFGDDDQLTEKSMLKIKHCPAIEDAFSLPDFRRFVLKDESAIIETSAGEFLKSANRSKPVLAFHFALAVQQGDITWQMLDSDTKGKITAIVSQIVTRLVAVSFE